MIDRVAKLITLAENASTEAEAEAAYAKVQAIVSKHQIDMELVRLHAEPKARELPTTRTIRIGERGKRSNAPLIELFDAIGRANDVRCMIAHDSTWLTATGYPSDLDTTEALWISLAGTMSKYADRHVRSKTAAWRSETVEVWDNYSWQYVSKPVSGQGARKSFCQGFTTRIAQRLQEARAVSIQEADHFHAEQVATGEIEASTLPVGMQLVMRDKGQDVERHMWDEYEKKYGRRKAGSWKGGRSSATRSGTASAAGRAAANSASLSGRRAIGV